MQKTSPLISFILLAVLHSHQGVGQSMFQKVIGGTAGNEITNHTQMTSDGGQIMVGYTESFGAGDADVYLVKTDAGGNLEWNKTYGGADDEIGYDVQPTLDGGYIVVGEIKHGVGQGDKDIFLVKTDSVGDTLWTRTYGGTDTDVGYSVKQTFDGGYVMAGYTLSYGTGGADLYVIKTNSLGDTTWTKTYGTGYHDFSYSIIQTADSGYIFTGETHYLTDDDAFLIKIDAIGDTMWTKTYGGGGRESGWRVIETMDGGYALAGWTNSFGAGEYDFLLIKTDSMGDTSWVRTYGGLDQDIGLSLVETPDTNYLVSGFTFSFGLTDGDAYGIAVDATGTLLWSMVYGGSQGESASSLELKADGGYVMGGYTYSLGGGSSEADYYVVHTDSAASSGACYESSVPTVTGSYPMTIGSAILSSVQTTIVGFVSTTVTTPAATSRDGYSVSITSSTNNVCNGDSSGTATALAIGGTLSYTYAWNDPLAQTTATADSLPSGTYMVVVTDGLGCMDSASVTITEPAVFAAAITDSSDINCKGDSSGYAVVTPTGGTSPYTYLWNDINAQTDSLADGLAPGNYNVTVTDMNNCQGQLVLGVSIVEPATVLSLSTSTTQDNCGLSNGTANVSATGATPPYTYSWNTPPVQTDSTASSLPAGTYVVVVTDSLGCMDSASVTITGPAVLAVAISDSSDVNCKGDSSGSATALAVGGTLSYTYSWDDPMMQSTATAGSLPAGTYVVVVTDSLGCMDSASVTITEPAVFTASVTDSSDINCKGDSSGYAAVTPTGGTSPYTYLWDDVNTQTDSLADGLPAGNYGVTVTDINNCQVIVSTTITEPAAVLWLSTSSTQANCGSSNGTANVSATGATPPYTYSWDTSPVQTDSTATGLPFGAYSVMVVDSLGCADSATVIIVNPGGLTVSITDSVNILCNGDSTGSATATPAGGTLPYTYLWSDANAQTDSMASGLTMGTYTVSVTDASLCGAAAVVTITEPTAISTSITTDAIDCFGNSTGTATVVTAGGISPYSYLWNTSSDSISITGLGAGTYSVTVTDSAGCMDSSGVTISDPPVLAVSISGSSDANCTGDSSGTATATATGGTLNYTYSWNDPLAQTTATADSLPSGTYMVVVTDGGGCMDSVSATIADPAVLAASITDSSDVNCNGDSTGYAAVTPGGGTGPYAYLWDDVNAQTDSLADGLPAGNYSVTVTDFNNCQIIVSTSVAESPALALTTSTTSATCGLSNGTANVSASGATPPYSYSWNTSPVQTGSTATGLAPGAHIITVIDSLGCAGSDTVDVGNISGPTVSITDSVNILCNGDSTGSATASATGGTLPYTYLWSTSSDSSSITGLAAGTYSVTTTDANGCSATDSITLSEPSALSSSISVTDESCEGSSDGILDLTVSGGTGPYAYAWSNADTSEDASNLTAGFYSVIITDGNGCTTQDTASVNATSAGPQTDSITGLTLVNPSDQEQYSVTQSAGSSYSWTVNGGSIISGQGTSTVQILWGNAGTGQVTVVETDSVGCVGDTVILSVQVATSSEIAAYISVEMIVYPNPFNHTATVIFSNETQDNYELLLYDMLGNRVRVMENITSNEVLVEKGNLAPGIYLIELQGTTRTFRGRIMVE